MNEEGKSVTVRAGVFGENIIDITKSSHTINIFLSDSTFFCDRSDSSIKVFPEEECTYFHIGLPASYLIFRVNDPEEANALINLLEIEKIEETKKPT